MSAQTAAELKSQACQRIDALADELVEVSQAIFANPELNFEEHYAHELLTNKIEQSDTDLHLQRSACGLETAFVAKAGSQGTNVGIVCEYDALPGIGHACGHNIIAAAGLGAGLALADLAHGAQKQVTILGTPAEEGGGGKVFMLEAGAFDGLDAAMMIHPAGADLATMNTLAIHRCTATYLGKASHAAAAADQGVNALDGAVLGYNAIAALRQHIGDSERVHGIFLHGGDKPNIVPSNAKAEWYVRSPTMAGLAALKDQVARCLNAGADAAGCEVEIEWIDPYYADMVDDQPLVDRYIANAASVGRTVAWPTQETGVAGSTDMGNVSQIVPSIHPMIKVAPADVAIHTEAFAEHAASNSGDLGVIDGAKMMAMTAIDVWLEPGIVSGSRVVQRDGSETA